MQTIEVISTDIGKRRVLVPETSQTDIDEALLLNEITDYLREIERLMREVAINQSKIDERRTKLAVFDDPEVKAQIEAKKAEEAIAEPVQEEPIV